MLKIIVVGVGGRMGQAVCELIEQSNNACIVAGVDRTEMKLSFPVYHVFSDIKENADCIIDFSNPALLDELLAFALKTNTAVVIATTGHSEKQLQLMNEASKTIPVFYSANMSIGVNLIAELCKQASTILGNTFDIEIVEKHHNKKLDSPSGTALLIADEINKEAKQPYNYVFDRTQKRQERSPQEIGIHSIRGGNVVGEHEVYFYGEKETITISHSALSREVFAQGALRAANFLGEKKAGFYSMKDIVRLDT